MISVPRSGSNFQRAAWTHNKTLHDSELTVCRLDKAVWIKTPRDRMQKSVKVGKVGLELKLSEAHNTELIVDRLGSVATTEFHLFAGSEDLEDFLSLVF